eukprot:jgi/Mesvir1/15828/Mv03381-RA.1
MKLGMSLILLFLGVVLPAHAAVTLNSTSGVSTGATDVGILFTNPNNCSDGIFCNGVERLLGSGSCGRSSFGPCDDRNPDTIDTCVEATKTCVHTPRINTPSCKVTCVRNCDNKNCGEDGCGGFCGTCPRGQGCQCSNQDADGNCLASLCAPAAEDGTCDSPFALGSGIINVPAEGELNLIIEGDTSHAVHVGSPECHQSAAPEVYYTFAVPRGRVYGVDIRSSGYDTVLQLARDCDNKDVISCSDDSTPPGRLGSRVTGLLEHGVYLLMLDGYSSTDNGAFTISAHFVDNCLPLCDGNFCGIDGCGFKCGSCGLGSKCRNATCYPDPCVKQCANANRTCGWDGCGGSCGSCPTPQKCVGEGFQVASDGTPVPSYCAVFPTCDNAKPVCPGGCTGSQYCGHDCKCYELDAYIPDLVMESSVLDDHVYLHTVNVGNFSCALVEGCVGGSGMRKLLRFTSSALNQGQTWDPVTPLQPKDRPDLYEWGRCHGHYHYTAFAYYHLYNNNFTALVKSGRKNAYCLADSARRFNGSRIQCSGAHDCGRQGLLEGWLDSYAWSDECSWLDVTDVPPGNYQLEVVINPKQVFHENSFENNAARVPVYLPCDFPVGPVMANRTGPSTCNDATGGVAMLRGAVMLATVLGALFLFF